MESENTRLRRAVADLTLDNQILPDPEGGGEGKLLSPARRRRCVDLVRGIYSISERRACRALVQYRSTQRYRARVAADEDGGYRSGQPVWAVRVSTGECDVAEGWVEGESQEGGADMEAGRAEGAGQAAKERESMAPRRLPR